MGRNYGRNGNRRQSDHGRGGGSGRRGNWRHNSADSIPASSDTAKDMRPRLSWSKPRGGSRRRFLNSSAYEARRAAVNQELMMKSEEARKCCECKQPEAAYRCPSCLKKYCSVLCYKTHKSGSNCEEIGDVHSTGESSMRRVTASTDLNIEFSNSRRKHFPTRKYLYPTEDTIKPEALEKLATDPLRSKMVNLFISSPLREKIRTIDSESNSEPLMETYMKDEEFSEFSSFVVDNLSNDFFDKVSVRNSQGQ